MLFTTWYKQYKELLISRAVEKAKKAGYKEGFDSAHEEASDAITVALNESKKSGMATCAATIDHVLEGCPKDVGKEELIARLKIITGRWAEYNPDTYKNQRGSLSRLSLHQLKDGTLKRNS